MPELANFVIESVNSSAGSGTNHPKIGMWDYYNWLFILIVYMFIKGTITIASLYG